MAIQKVIPSNATILKLSQLMVLLNNEKRLKIYYMTQASTRPPTFVFFVNRSDLFHFSYQRYLENQIRDIFGLDGTPVRFIVRERGDGSK